MRIVSIAAVTGTEKFSYHTIFLYYLLFFHFLFFIGGLHLEF